MYSYFVTVLFNKLSKTRKRKRDKNTLTFFFFNLVLFKYVVYKKRHILLNLEKYNITHDENKQ